MGAGLGRSIWRAGLAAGLLAGAIGPAALAQQPAKSIVAPDGSADFRTITAAIEAAADGDSIRIRPGVYPESLHIDKAITLRGVRWSDDVVIAPPADDLLFRDLDGEDRPVVIHVDGADATIRNLSIEPELGSAVLLLLDGGAPTVREVHAPGFVAVRGDADARIEASTLGRVSLWGPNETVLRGNTVDDMIWASQGARTRIEDNLVLDRPIQADRGANVEIVGNTVRPLDDEVGINVLHGATIARVTWNSIEGGWLGIHLEVTKVGLVDGNVLRGQDVGMLIKQTRTVVRGNDIAEVADRGITLVGDGIHAEGNIVVGGRAGLVIEAPDEYPAELLIDEPTRVTGNELTGASHYGMVVLGHAVIEGNSICGGREPLRVIGGEPVVGTNDLCEVE
jgi:hypothetical protein